MDHQRAQGISWFLPEDTSCCCSISPSPRHVSSSSSSSTVNPLPPIYGSSVESPLGKHKRRRRVRSDAAGFKDAATATLKTMEEVVDVIDIEDEDHSFTSFFVEMEVLSEAPNIQQRPMVLLLLRLRTLVISFNYYRIVYFFTDSSFFVAV